MKKKTVVFFVAIAAVIVFILGGWLFQVRFTYPPLNYWAVAALFFAFPFGLLALTWFFQGRILRAVIVVAAVLVGIPTGGLAWLYQAKQGESRTVGSIHLSCCCKKYRLARIGIGSTAPIAALRALSGWFSVKSSSLPLASAS